jgi:internalin A
MIRFDEVGGSPSRKVASMPVSPISRPWRRFLRFSVRGLIVLVIVIGVWLGWMAQVVRSARMQRDAVVAIRNAGGVVSYNWEWNYGSDIPGGKPWAPSWLSDRIGVDYFGYVTTVSVASSAKRTDLVLAPVACLDRLQRLRVLAPKLSDDDMAHLQRLTNLSELNLARIQITDAGLLNLKGLTRLSVVDLSDTPVTDAGLAHLAGAYISVLGLNGTRITGSGLAHLKGLPNLSELNVPRTQITDADLSNLQGLTKLSVLNLARTQITDAGLSNLKGLTKLSVLNLVQTQVTDAGVKELQHALPNLTIYR